VIFDELPSRITVTQMPQMVVFTCCCGAQFGIPLFVAHDIGLI